MNFAGPTTYRIAFGPRAGQKVLTQKILTHLDLQVRAPPRAPARRSRLQAA